MNSCLECGESTSNPKYCSRSCSTTATNRTKPRRKKVRVCAGEDCTTATYSKQKYCRSCRPNHVDWSAVTLGELRGRAKYQVHAQIRELARRKVRKHLQRHDESRTCSIPGCTWSHTPHVAHVRAIKDFLDTATIREINDWMNLVPLCPNHHWIFDNKRHLLEDDDGCIAFDNSFWRIPPGDD